MRALTWQGKHDVRVETVPDPEIVNPRDAILEVTSTAICGSDLHLYDGVIPGMVAGDILGHEFMGKVVETGPKSTLQKGQRVVVPFTISCGKCFFCEKQLYSACDNSNPVEKQDLTEPLYGHALSALFGYSHLTGGYPGGQAEYVRVPFSDVGPIVVPDGLEDDKVLFLSDILPTGWMGAENADIEEGDTVAVWGCGPVGLFAIQSALAMGAGKVIAIDEYPTRLALARQLGAEIIDFKQTRVLEALMEMSGGLGPDAVIDAVGMESHGFAPDTILDNIKQNVGMGADSAHALREAILAVRKGGRVSIPGVYGGFLDKFPLGAMMEKGLQIRTGQTHVQRYLKDLLHKIGEGELDTTFLISHRLPLEEAAEGYRELPLQAERVDKGRAQARHGDELMAGRKLAVVTGASTGIGLEIAHLAADDGCDLVIVANEPAIETAAATLRAKGVGVTALEVDLTTEVGVDRLWDEIRDRDVDYLVANAGRGLGDAFLDQDWDRIEEVIALNVTGTTDLLHRIVRQMRASDHGRILIVGSIAGLMPGSYQAVYNATKAYLDTLAWALRDECRDTEVSVTCLMPGPTDTEFFERADMEDTPVGQKDKADPAKVARAGWQRDEARGGRRHARLHEQGAVGPGRGDP